MLYVSQPEEDTLSMENQEGVGSELPSKAAEQAP
jgi:hypothetical protein